MLNKTNFISNTTIISSSFMNNLQDELILSQAELGNIKQTISANVLDYGVVEGLNADVTKNTRNFQKMVDECVISNKVIYFPSGVFLLGQINLGTKNNITITGVSSSFASLMNKNINTGEINDTFTRIVCCASEGQPLFVHNNCVTVLNNLGIYNEYSGKGTGLRKNTILNTSGTNKEKGKVFATECAFVGFNVGFGANILVGESASSILQTCVVANRCRFVNNGIAINQNVDGRLIDCSFNKNDYAMVFRQSSGFTTVNGCRIEWINKNGIYIDGGHHITVTSTEFDRCGYAGLYVNNAINCTFSGNMFRRNGADTTFDNTNYENNSHIVMKHSTGCILTNNNTVAKHILDTSSGGATRPSNVSKIQGSSQCIITNNILTGCTKTNISDANLWEGNANCVLANNVNS